MTAERSPLNTSLWRIAEIDRELEQMSMQQGGVVKLSSVLELLRERRMHKSYIQSYKPREIQ